MLAPAHPHLETHVCFVLFMFMLCVSFFLCAVRRARVRPLSLTSLSRSPLSLSLSLSLSLCGQASASTCCPGARRTPWWRCSATTPTSPRTSSDSRYVRTCTRAVQCSGIELSLLLIARVFSRLSLSSPCLARSRPCSAPVHHLIPRLPPSTLLHCVHCALCAVQVFSRSIPRLISWVAYLLAQFFGVSLFDCIHIAYGTS